MSTTAPIRVERSRFRGRLARSIVQSLLFLTFIPLIVMGGAAYLRARALLRAQAVEQMQALVSAQVVDVQTTIQTKQIRLDRIVRRGDFAAAIESGLNLRRGSEAFNASREQILGAYQAVNKQEASPTFNQFFILRPDGVIQFASNTEWEGIVLDSAILESLRQGNLQSLAIYDLPPIYPGQFVLLTLRQYTNSSGASLATVVGVSEPQAAEAILQTLVKFSPDAEAYFVTLQGEFVGIDPFTSELTRFDPSASQSQSLLATFDEMEAGVAPGPHTVEFTATDGRPVLAQSVWLTNLNTGIVLEVHQSTILGQLNTLVPFTIAIFVITLAAMWIVIGVATNRFIKPLLSLADTTRRFAEGDWRERSPIQRSDELGFLAATFNEMADELSTLYRSLEFRVEERTRQIRTAAEVAQSITTAFNLDELLDQTAHLIVERFGYYHAGIFMVDRVGKYAALRAAHGPAAERMLERGHRLAVGSNSIIGWVTANNKPRVASDVEEDPIHLKNELMPETRAEAGIPISTGGLVLGALDVQSTEVNAFDAETVVVLQTLANQIAAAIQNVGLIESAQVNFSELERLYRASRQIAEAETEREALELTGRVLQDAPYPAMVLAARGETLELIALSDPDDPSLRTPEETQIGAHPAEVARVLSGGPAIIELGKAAPLPMALVRLPRSLGCVNAAFLPVMRGEELAALIILGARRKQPISDTAVQPYGSLADLVATALAKVHASEQTEERLAELEALTSISQAISTSGDLSTFYSDLHEQIRRVIGDLAFLIALYDEKTNSISVPYSYEEGNVSSLEPFPLGEGLTSILIRSREPLMLIEDVERRAAALGAKTIGKPARSWMGAPLLLQNKALGAIIVQDIERERAFDEDDLRFLTALAAQIAGFVHNIRLVEESRRRALELETAAEIARDISGSLNLDELLLKAVNLIRERFEFYHAAVFLLDMAGEYAVIREATGEAGAQMKRAGHKLGVGSKSIVGYVAGKGEALIVNDAAKDATYYPNPLLPETQAEAAIPLKLGERILGVLDVQSTVPYSFTPESLRTLQVLADQLAVAVVNSELFAETQEHLSQHRLLHHITTTAASGTTLEEALDSAVSGLQVTLGGDRVAILLLDKDRQSLEVRAAVGYAEDVLNMRIPPGSGITGWVAAHRRPLRVDDVTQDARYIQVSANTRSELAIPLIFRNELLGVINVESEQVAAYTENDEEMLGTLGGSLAAIIANARLLDQIRRQAERERMLYEVTSKIRRSTDMQTIMATTVSELRRAVGARRAQIKIALPEEKSGDGGSGSPDEGGQT